MVAALIRAGCDRPVFAFRELLDAAPAALEALARSPDGTESLNSELRNLCIQHGVAFTRPCDGRPKRPGKEEIAETSGVQQASRSSRETTCKGPADHRSLAAGRAGPSKPSTDISDKPNEERKIKPEHGPFAASFGLSGRQALVTAATNALRLAFRELRYSDNGPPPAYTLAKQIIKEARDQVVHLAQTHSETELAALGAELLALARTLGHCPAVGAGPGAAPLPTETTTRGPSAPSPTPPCARRLPS